MKISGAKISGFKAGAIVFLTWGLFNTALSVATYGVESGEYWWISNISLFALAYSLWTRSRSGRIALLSAALITQTFLIVDNLWRMCFGKNLLGVIEFLYQPGMPTLEFLLSHYHFFLIPTWIFALSLIPKTGKDRSPWVALVTSVLVLGASYFLFPREQNLNCAHEPCFPALITWSGRLYSASFFILVTAVSMILCILSDRLFEKIQARHLIPTRMKAAYFGGVVVALALTLLDLNYKRSLPRFRCAGPFEDSTVKVRCLYTEDFDTSIMKLVYSIENKSKRAIDCTTRMRLHGPLQVLHSSLLVRPGQKINLPVLLEYPKESVEAKLMASCSSPP